MKKVEFNKIEKTMKGNEEAKKIVLECHKSKKFNYLKYNPQKRQIAIAEDNVQKQQCQSYASAVKGNCIKAPLQKKVKQIYNQ